MKYSFVDVHHHLAYGMDDGPKSSSQMAKMLRRAAKQGIGTIIATPHVTPGVHRFHVNQYRKALQEAREICAEEGLQIEILEGCEVLYTDQTPRLLREGKVPTLAGTDYVLVEFSPDVRYDRLREALEKLMCEGYRPLIAHVERYACLVHRPSRAERMKKETGVLFQMNCDTIVDDQGWWVRRFVRRMLENELIDALGTDAHNVSSRAAHMKQAYRAIQREYGLRYARRLTNGSFLTE